VLAGCLSVLVAVPAVGQQNPVVRDFAVGTASRYRIQLKARSEVEGSRPVQIGVKTYVAPFSRSAEGQLSWQASRRVLSVAGDGSAEIEEILEDFQGVEVGEKASDEKDDESKKLLRVVSEALAHWRDKHTLRYRETREGQLLNLTPEGVPALGEELPRLLSLWLLRALRPAVALPATPPRLGDSWQEPRTAQLPNWADVRGSESGEWLPALAAAEPAMRLHIVQQLSGAVVSGAEKPPEGTAYALFHGESLNTLSLGDGRLLSATRSATRELTWTLAPVEGLRERPQFRGRVSVEVEIEACDDTSCPTSDSDPPAVRKRP